MTFTTKIVSVSVALLMLISCTLLAPSVQQQQAQKAYDAAQSVSFTDNAEIENIQHRLKLTGDPGLLGYILLLNDAGQPIYYSTVKGKVTSGGKRLTAPGNLNGYDQPSDEGTYGSSAPYIFFWTTSGQYIQWNGAYLFSDQPIRPTIEPLVVQVVPAEK